MVRKSIGMGLGGLFAVSTIGLCLLKAAPLLSESKKEPASQNFSPWEEGLKPKISESPQLLRTGKQVYQTSCFICHGKTGDGTGSASRLMQTKPRNFTSGEFKLRTTLWGALPTDEDLFRTITLGFPQYGMPSFRTLSAKDRWSVVYYIKGMMMESGLKQGQAIAIGKKPPTTQEAISHGKALYEKYGCAACHGLKGKGDGPLARHFPKHFQDKLGTSVPPRDFTKGKMYFKSGGSSRDIVRTLVTGFEGTKMVSYLPILENSKDLKPFWDLAHYIEQISEEEEKEP